MNETIKALLKEPANLVTTSTANKTAVCKQKIAAARALYAKNLETEVIDAALSLIAQDIDIALEDRFEALHLMSVNTAQLKDDIYAAIARGPAVPGALRMDTAEKILDASIKQSVYLDIAGDRSIDAGVRTQWAQYH